MQGNADTFLFVGNNSTARSLHHYMSSCIGPISIDTSHLPIAVNTSTCSCLHSSYTCPLAANTPTTTTAPAARAICISASGGYKGPEVPFRLQPSPPPAAICISTSEGYRGGPRTQEMLGNADTFLFVGNNSTARSLHHYMSACIGPISIDTSHLPIAVNTSTCSCLHLPSCCEHSNHNHSPRRARYLHQCLGGDIKVQKFLFVCSPPPPPPAAICISTSGGYRGGPRTQEMQGNADTFLFVKQQHRPLFASLHEFLHRANKHLHIASPRLLRTLPLPPVYTCPLAANTPTATAHTLALSCSHYL